MEFTVFTLRPCYHVGWRKQKISHFYFAFFFNCQPAFVHDTIVTCVSRYWLQPTHTAHLCPEICVSRCMHHPNKLRSVQLSLRVNYPMAAATKISHKMELCVGWSVLQLSLASHKAKSPFACFERIVFMQRQRMKDLLLQARVVVRSSNMKISRRPSADYVKKFHQKACRACSTIIAVVNFYFLFVCFRFDLVWAASMLYFATVISSDSYAIIS